MRRLRDSYGHRQRRCPSASDVQAGESRTRSQASTRWAVSATKATSSGLVTCTGTLPPLPASVEPLAAAASCARRARLRPQKLASLPCLLEMTAVESKDCCGIEGLQSRVRSGNEGLLAGLHDGLYVLRASTCILSASYFCTRLIPTCILGALYFCTRLKLTN